MFNKDEESRGTTLLYHNITIEISVTGSTLLGDSSSPILQSGSVPTHRSLLLGGLDSDDVHYLYSQSTHLSNKYSLHSRSIKVKSCSDQSHLENYLKFLYVPGRGLEPPHLAIQPPQDCASASSATRARSSKLK